MYGKNDVQGLVQDLREFKDGMLQYNNIISSRVYSQGVAKMEVMYS